MPFLSMLPGARNMPCSNNLQFNILCDYNLNTEQSAQPTLQFESVNHFDAHSRKSAISEVSKA